MPDPSVDYSADFGAQPPRGETRFVTAGGIEVARTATPFDPAGLADVITQIDARRGGTFSSGMEYPGRYSRWHMGYVDPCVELSARGRELTATALNERGAVLLPAIGAALDRAGTRLSYDFSHVSTPERMAELCPHLEVAFLSAPGADADEAAELGGRAVATGAATAVVTRGRHGSLAVCGGVHHQPPVAVGVVDTLGAGDAYIAACISALVDGAPLVTALERGAHAAARTCTHYGAWQELEALEASA